MSPIYCDNRIILSYPAMRTYIRQQFVDTVNENFGKPDVIAGVATGGIAHGVLVAQELGLPFIYVRPEPKGHGLSNAIEGHAEKGQSVIVIEDLISTGGSSMKAIEHLKNFGLLCQRYDFHLYLHHEKSRRKLSKKKQIKSFIPIQF
ncbi:MAG: hypothetical protein KatS3mg028_1138 [Bacteroidia bacterium]|nr:MAG: hypothetical protein KatS3mg028_1138 [Bacteroidia bacterium]